MAGERAPRLARARLISDTKYSGTEAQMSNERGTSDCDRYNATRNGQVSPSQPNDFSHWRRYPACIATTRGEFSLRALAQTMRTADTRALSPASFELDWLRIHQASSRGAGRKPGDHLPVHWHNHGLPSSPGSATVLVLEKADDVRAEIQKSRTTHDQAGALSTRCHRDSGRALEPGLAGHHSRNCFVATVPRFL